MQNLENLAYICKIIARLFSMSKKTVVTTNGKRGGNLVGKPHKNKQGQDVGGIKAVVTDANNRPVELEGGEVIINKEASKKHWRELSRINQSAGNGVPINEPIDPHDEDPEEYSKGGKIEFNPNQLPNKWILNYAKNIKKNHPEIWKLGGNIYGNQAFENLLRVSERGYWLDSEEWFYVKWRSFVARHKGDFRIAGVVAMLKWVDKVDKGWQYMKDLIEEEIKKRSDKKSGWKTKKTERMSGGGELEKGIKTEMEHKNTIEKFKRKGVSDRQVATSIAKDHLEEDPKYYSKLSKMEKKFDGGGDVVIDETIANNQMANPVEGMAIVNILEENDMFPNVRYVLEVHKENGEIVGVNYGIPNGFSFFSPIGQFRNQFVPATQKQVNRAKMASKTLFEKGGEIKNKIQAILQHIETNNNQRVQIDDYSYVKKNHYGGYELLTYPKQGQEGDLSYNLRTKEYTDEQYEAFKNMVIRKLKGKTGKINLYAQGGQTERQQAKIGYTMREFKEGKLKTSYGEKVTDEKQALAIALSKAGVEKKGEGGTIEDAMSISEMENYVYSEKGRLTVEQMPKYITDGTIVYERSTFKKNNGLKKGMCIVSTYSKYNYGAEFWRIEGFVKERKWSNPNYVKIDGKGEQEILANIIEQYDTMKELLEAMNCKNLSELEQLSIKSREENRDIDFSILFRDITDNGLSNQLGNYYYISDGKWARGGGAEPLSFIEYIPLEGGESKIDSNFGDQQRHNITHDDLNKIYQQDSISSNLDYQVGDKGFYNGKQTVPIEITKITEKNIYFRNEETGEIKRSERKNFERLFESGSGVTNTSPTHAMPIIDDTPSPKKDDTNVSTDDLDSKIEKLQKKIKTFQGIIENPKSEKQRSFAKREMEKARKELEELISQKHGSVQNYVHSQLNKDDKGRTQQPTSKTQVNYYELFKSKNEVIEMSNNETMAVQLGRFVKMADEDRLMRMEDIEDFKKAIDKLG